MTNLGHVRYVPGDIVRDRKDNIDYVVQSVTTMAAGAGLAVYGLALFGNSVKHFHGLNYADLDEQLGHVKHNDVSRLSPAEVKAQFNASFDRILRGNQELVAKINEPENQIFRDLLLVASEVDERNFDKHLIELAENMVVYGRGTPTRDSILTTLKNAAQGTSINDQFIEDLADAIHRETRIESRRLKRINPGTNINKVDIDPNFLSDFMSRADGQLSFSAEQTLRQARRGFGRKASIFIGDRKDTGRISPGGAPIFDINPSADFRKIFRNGQSPEGELGLKAKQVKEMLEIIGGSPGSQYARRADWIHPGMADRSPMDRLQGMLTMALGSPRVAAHITETRGDFILEQIAKGRLTPELRAIIESPSFNPVVRSFEQDFSAGRFPHLRGQYGRRTAIMTERNTAGLRGVVDIEKIAKLNDFKNGRSRFVALDTNSFIRDVLGDAKLSIGKKSLSLRESEAVEEVMKLFQLGKTGNSRREVFLPPSIIKEIRDAKLAGRPVNLKKVAKIAESYRTQLGTEYVQQVSSKLNGRYYATGEPVLVGISKRKLRKNPGEKALNAATQYMKETGDMNPLIERVAGLKKVQDGYTRLFVVSDNSGQHMFAHQDLGHLLKMVEGRDDLDFSHVIKDLSGNQQARIGLNYVDVLSEHTKGWEMTVTSDMAAHMEDAGMQAVFKQAQMLNKVRLSDYNLRTVDGLLQLAEKHKGLAGKVTGRHNNVRFVGGPTSQREAYTLGQSNMKVAFAQIKGKEDQFTRLIGSEMNIPVQEQISRAKRFFNSGNAMILDIERATYESGTSWITEIGLGQVSRGSLVQLLEKKTKNGRKIRLAEGTIAEGKNELEGMVERAEQLINLSKMIKDVDVIGTQSASDFNEILKMTSVLKGHFKGDKRMLGKIREAESIFKNTQKNKLFDMQIIHQLSGEKLGSTSQAYLEAKKLGMVQAHGAWPDVFRSWELAMGAREEFLDTTKKITIYDAGLPKWGGYFLDQGNMAQKGRLRQLVGLHEDGGGVSATFQEMEAVKVGKKIVFKPTGRMSIEEAGNVAQIGARLHRNTIPVTEKTWLDHVSEAENDLIDISERRVRASLNPLSQTYWDELNEHNPLYDGPFAATQIRVEAKARELFADVEETFNKMQPKKRGADISISGGHKLEAQWNETVEQIVNSRLQGIDSSFQDRVKHQLRKTFFQQEKDILMGQNRPSALADFHQSGLGRKLVHLAMQDAESVETGSDLYSMFTNTLIAHAYKEIQTGTDLTTNTLWNPRFSIKLGEALGIQEQRAAAQLTKENMHIVVQQVAQDASSKMLFQARSLSEEKFYDFYKGAGLGDDIQGAMTLQRQLHDLAVNKDLANNLDAWKAAINDVAHNAPTGKYGKIAQTHKALVHGEIMGEAMQNTIKRRIEGLGEAEGALKQVGNELLEGVEQLRASHNLSFTEALQTKFVHMMHGDVNSESLLTRFFQDKGETLDLSKLSAHYTPELLDKLENVVKFAHTTLKAEDGDAFYGPQNMLSWMRAAKNMSWENGERGVGQQAAGGEMLFDYLRNLTGMNEEQLIQHSAGLQVPNYRSAGLAMRQMHELSTQAAMTESVKMSLKGPQHELLLTSALDFGEKHVNQLAVPLLALGGAIGLYAAAHTPTNDAFSQGKISDRTGSPILANSEIPGHDAGARVWHGEESPFRVDINFRGFVKNKTEHDMLMSQIYNSISGQMEFQTKNSEVIDRRNRNHSLAAMDAMRKL